MYLIQDVQILMNSWMIHALKLENLNQSFDTPKGKFTLFEDFNLDIKDFSGEGQFISILGKVVMGNLKQEKFLWYFNNIRHFHGCQFLTM